MTSKFDAKEWFLKLSTENRFTPKKKKVNEKMCYVVNSGFVAHYASLETDMQRRQVRAFLLKSFKSLTSLKFGDKFNQPVDILENLTNLNTLIFGKSFDRPIEPLRSLINLKILKKH